jgi:hypothetical protein
LPGIEERFHRRNDHRGDDAVPGFARRLRQRQLLIAVCDESIASSRKRETPSTQARAWGSSWLRQRCVWLRDCRCAASIKRKPRTYERFHRATSLRLRAPPSVGPHSITNILACDQSIRHRRQTAAPVQR